jgi:LemA protein
MGVAVAEYVLAALWVGNATIVGLFSLLLLLIVLGLIGYSVAMRNDLVRTKNSIEKSFADIDRLLKQRHDELPKLLETCRAYLSDESKMLQFVVDARTAYSRATTPSQKAQADHLLSGALRHLWAAAAKNADLKRNTTFVQLQTRIGQLEEKLATGRDRYNEEVNCFNARIAQFPHTIVARVGKLHPREPFQAGKADP